MRITAITALALGLLAPVSVSTVTAQAAPAPSTIVDVAIGAGSFKTLVKALETAGLVETLRGKGPFTVFAPTDAAFAKLPAGTVETLLADPAKLRAILTYHVLPGEVKAAKVVGLQSATTVNGQEIRIRVDGGQVYAGDARVTATDVSASNGVIHVVDTVLLPAN
jgi:uncharacterized surface protein with fasciclin (FAS1) repeats